MIYKLGELLLQVFRDHKIDGGCLPLLTEQHLTQGLGLKLGPALKLLTALRRWTTHATALVHGPAPDPAPAPATAANLTWHYFQETRRWGQGVCTVCSLS